MKRSPNRKIPDMPTEKITLTMLKKTYWREPRVDVNREKCSTYLRKEMKIAPNWWQQKCREENGVTSDFQSGSKTNSNQ